MDAVTVTLLLSLFILMVIVVLFFFRLRFRRRPPVVRNIFEEKNSTESPTPQNSDMTRIRQIMNKIHEIEKKIEIVKIQNISEEAKNTIIKELEDEKKRLEEEISITAGFPESIKTSVKRRKTP